MHNVLPRILAAGFAAVFLALVAVPLAVAQEPGETSSTTPPLLPSHGQPAPEARSGATPAPPVKKKVQPRAEEGDGPRIVTASHRWVMGSGETLADAKRMCRAEAVRSIVEQAGVVVESVSEVENFVLTRDQSRSYAAALVEVQSSKERLEPAGDGMAVICTVQARVDKADLAKGVRELQGHPDAARQAEDAWGRAERLAREERDLRAAAPAPGTQGWQALQNKRSELVRSLEDLRREKAAFARDIEEETRRAVEIAEPGMTLAEVEKLLGTPRSVLPQNERGYACGRWGEVWVVFRRGVAECVRSRLQDIPGVVECQCDGLSTSILKR